MYPVAQNQYSAVDDIDLKPVDKECADVLHLFVVEAWKMNNSESLTTEDSGLFICLLRAAGSMSRFSVTSLSGDVSPCHLL